MLSNTSMTILIIVLVGVFALFLCKVGTNYKPFCLNIQVQEVKIDTVATSFTLTLKPKSLLGVTSVGADLYFDSTLVRVVKDSVKKFNLFDFELVNCFSNRVSFGFSNGTTPIVLDGTKSLFSVRFNVVSVADTVHQFICSNVLIYKGNTPVDYDRASAKFNVFCRNIKQFVFNRFINK